MNCPSDFRRTKSEARSIDELIRFGCRGRFSAQSWGIKRTDNFRDSKSEARSVDELIKGKRLSRSSAQRGGAGCGRGGSGQEKVRWPLLYDTDIEVQPSRVIKNHFRNTG